GHVDQANQCVFAAFNIKGGTRDAVTCYGTNSIFAISCNAVEFQGINAFDAASCVSNGCVAAGNSSGIISSPAIRTNFENDRPLGFATRSMGCDCPAVFAGPGDGFTEINSGSTFFEYKVVSGQSDTIATVNRGSTACQWSLGVYAFYQTQSP